MIEKGEKFLPIGTVCMLTGGTKRVMITGFCAIANDDETDNKMYDYSGCMYPEGFLSSDETALFDHEQIAQVFHLGLVDEEETAFKVKLNELLKGEAAVEQPQVAEEMTIPAMPIEQPQVTEEMTIPTMPVEQPQVAPVAQEIPAIPAIEPAIASIPTEQPQAINIASQPAPSVIPAIPTIEAMPPQTNNDLPPVNPGM